MPQPRSTGAWPAAGELRTKCTFQYATPTTDSMGGRSEPTWTDFGGWDAKVMTVPGGVSESKEKSSYEFEGRFRRDVWEYFHGISRPDGLDEDINVSMRVIWNGLTLKVFDVENPLFQNRTLIVKCAKAVNT
jgi:head-tail adaptor